MNVHELVSVETYNHVMRIAAPLLAVMFWSISFWFVWYGKRNRDWKRYLGMLAWTANVALFWTLGAYLRLATDYPAPTVAMSLYSVILYLQAAFSMLFALIVFRIHALPPQGPDPYSTLE